MKVAYIAFGVGWLLVIGPAQAGPPFVTDDPEVPAPGTWEINVPFIFERTPGETEMEAPLFDLNYGLPDLQLTAEFPIAVADDDGAGAVAGAGDLLLGVKWRFLNNEQSQFQLGIYPQLLLPTGDHARGLGEGRPAFVLPLLAQKNWEKRTLYGNIGFWWQTAAQTHDYVYAGQALSANDQRLTLAAELLGNSPKERGEGSDVAFNVGGVWKLSKHVNLLFSGGRDIVGQTHAMGYIGLQFLTE